jgi:metal-responsive CopG/Arc/MetJ family transcriptional regulator
MRTSILLDEEKERKNFYLSTKLVREAESIAQERNWNFSELLRTALKEYLKKLKREKLEREIAEACQAYAGIDKEMASDWAQIETDPWK